MVSSGWRRLAAALAITTSALAQTVVSGSLVDPSDRPVPDAAVSIAGRTTRTSASGEFRFEGLPAGEYRLTAKIAGFESIDKTLRLDGRPVRLALRLSLARVRSQLTVDSDTEAVSAGAGVNRDAIAVDRSLLDTLPVLDLNSVAALSRFLDPASGGAGGGEGGISLIVDGMEARNVGVSASAIQEIRINQNPYTAEYPRWSRRRIEILTKSGADAYHGTLNFNFRDSAADARNAFASSRASEQRRIYEGSILGPVGGGKTTSFLVTGSQDEDDQQATIVAQGPSGAIRENVPTPRRDTRASARLAHQFGENHSSSIQVNYQDTFQYLQGAGGTTLPEAAVNYRFRENELVVNHRSTLSPRALMQFRVLVANYWTPLRPVSTLPRIAVSDAFTGGGAQTNLLRTEAHTSITWMITHTAGRHTLKYGINIPDWSRRGLSDRSLRQGAYSFASIDDYRAGRPYSGLFQTGNPQFIFLEKTVGGFIQDDWQLRPGLSIATGLRYDWQNYIGGSDNFAPRLAIAWAPDKSRHWVVRLGAGVFYDRTGPNPIGEGLRYGEGHLSRYLLTSPSFPTGSLAQMPLTTSSLQSDIALGRTYQFSAGIERQLTKQTTLTAGYIGWRAPHQLRSRDLNAPLAPYTGGRPNPQFGARRIIEAASRAVSDSFEVMLRGNLGATVQGTAQYVFGKAMNDSSGYGWYPASSSSPSGEWARSDTDRRHQFNLLATARPHRWLNFGVAAAMLSAIPFNITTGRDDNRDGLALDRPAGVARNTGHGPGQISVDVRWFHDFKHGEKGPTFTVSADSFNILNHTNPASYVGAVSSPFYGRGVTALAPRRMQGGLRFQF